MKQNSVKTWRYYAIIILFVVLALGLLSRLFYLNVIDRSFLLKQSDARVIRTVTTPAYRGMITDRDGTPLAVSTPVVSVWVNPQLFNPTAAELTALASDLSMTPQAILKRVPKNTKREFIYLKRQMPPEVQNQIKALDISGVNFQHEYKRFYPSGEVDAHVVGFTNINDKGQEGLELAYNKWLSGTDGKMKVMKDRLGHVIADIKQVKPTKQGNKLVLSIDQNIQFLAYRALKEAVEKYHATAGSVVVMNPKTGEILAMVNQPSYNPNDRPADTNGRYRNRALTDMFEPGSVIKPFNVTLALESGKYTPETKINTHPGWMKVGRYVIEDDGLDHGIITLTQLLKVSSNIGAAKVMMSLTPSKYWQLLRDVGFGQRTDSGFPGESSGSLPVHNVWRPSAIAALAYGYGIAVTDLQLAHAYSILANHGVSVPVTFLKRQQTPVGAQVIPAKVATTVTKMLETVMEPGGTGYMDAIPGYKSAGKTGTAYIAGPHGYYKNKYVATFAGMAPAADPQLVVVVTIRNPQGRHFGGLVSGPVFSKVMSGALRMLNISPVATSTSVSTPASKTTATNPPQSQ